MNEIAQSLAFVGVAFVISLLVCNTIFISLHKVTDLLFAWRWYLLLSIIFGFSLAYLI